MAEHDDFLLDEDFASLPDINDEEYSNTDNEKTVSIDETSNNQVEDQFENFLDLNGFDVFEESEEENNTNSIELKIKEDNINSNEIHIKEDKRENNFHKDQPIVYQKKKNFKTQKEPVTNNKNSTIPIKDLHEKLRKLHYQQKRNVNNTNQKVDNNNKKIKETRIQGDNCTSSNIQEKFICFQADERESNIHEFRRYNSIDNQGSFQPNKLPLPQIMYQPSYNFQIPGMNFNSYNIPSTPATVFSPLKYESIYKSLQDQPRGFCNNERVCSNYGMHYSQIEEPLYPVNQNETLPRSQILPMNQNLSINRMLPINQNLPVNQMVPINQNLPINQVIPVNQNLLINQNLPVNQMVETPMKTNTRRTLLPTPTMQIIGRQSGMEPNYSQSVFPNQHTYRNINQNEYADNLLWIQNYLNGHKILVNRNFRNNNTEREIKMRNNTEYEEFLKKNACTSHHSSSNSCQRIKTDDPYFYFSDVWQEKKVCKFDPITKRRSFSPEVTFLKRSRIIDDEYKSEWKSNNKDYERERKSITTSKERNLCYKGVQMDRNNIKNDNSNNVKNKQEMKTQTRKRKRLFRKRLGKKVDDNNNNKRIVSPKKQKFESENNVDMDPEMKEYCKKIEEQNQLRKKLLQEKENRRKMLAMEKFGIKRESFTDSTGKVIHDVGNESKPQEVKVISSSTPS